MVKVRVKPTEIVVENYVLGTVEGTYKTYRYWRGQGYSEDHAIQNACNYAVGQLFAGVNAQDRVKYADIFETIAAIAKSLVQYCQTGRFPSMEP